MLYSILVYYQCERAISGLYERYRLVLQNLESVTKNIYISNTAVISTSNLGVFKNFIFYSISWVHLFEMGHTLDLHFSEFNYYSPLTCPFLEQKKHASEKKMRGEKLKKISHQTRNKSYRLIGVKINIQKILLYFKISWNFRVQNGVDSFVHAQKKGKA